MNLIVKTFDELTAKELYEILKARSAVFVVEQNCVYQDPDDKDEQSLHVFYEEDGRVLAYLRAFVLEQDVVRIGRVLTVRRGAGLGGKLLKEGVEQVKKRFQPEKISIEAQCQAIGFYEKGGFHVTSDEFMLDGIPHVQMEMTVSNDIRHPEKENYGRNGQMKVEIREYKKDDADAVRKIWNQVVEDGVAFPQEEGLTAENADEFFSSQTYTGVAEDKASGEIVGMYILHPNNVGRCGHICNASYAVRKDIRGEHIGEKLVLDCLETAHRKGFRILQFNAVVANNVHAIHLYERLGFTRIGTVEGGFRMPDGSFEDIILFYHKV